MKHLLIDGSNLVRRIYGFDIGAAKKDHYRADTAKSALFVSIFRRFLKRCPKLAAFYGRVNASAEVYFDGKPRDIYETGAGRLTCVCSGYISSDERILDRIAALPRSERRQVLLVTFDRNLAAQARGLSAHVINPDRVIAKVREYGLDFYAYV